MEEKLQWGEPVNGLRMALVRPQALGGPEAGEHIDLKLVVQNVSAGAVPIQHRLRTRRIVLKLFVRERRRDSVLAPRLEAESVLTWCYSPARWRCCGCSRRHRRAIDHVG